MKICSNKWSFLVLCLSVVFSIVFSACRQSGHSTYRRDFTKADIEKLRWIEGRWRGGDQKGQNPFFERYQFTSDSRIETTSFPDTTFTKQGDSGFVYFENGEIIHKGGEMVWAASKLTDSMIEFVPKEKATNSFVWQK